MFKNLWNYLFPAPKPCDLCGQPSVGFAIEGRKKLGLDAAGKQTTIVTADDVWHYCRDHDPCSRRVTSPRHGRNEP